LPLKEEAIFELRREIIDFYLKEGFFDVKVNIAMQKKGKNLVLFYLVKEGERYQIGNINIHSNFIRADNLLKLITEKDYSQENLNRIIKKIIDFYWEIGFPFVKIEPKNFELADKKVNFDIFIDEGEMVKINDLRAIGEMVIPPPILKKSSGFTKPFYFQKSLLEKFKRNIYKNLKITWSDYFLSKSEEGGYFLNFYFPFLRKNNFLFFFLICQMRKAFILI
jgi:outer membrane translocation and assembly module TamA